MRRSLADIRRRTFDGWRGHEVFIQSPGEAGIHVVMSSMGCLTHLVRYVSYHSLSGRQHRSITTQCNMILGTVRTRILDPSGEMFACHKCIAVAEQAGEPTFNLVPNTGCEASGGQRYRPLTRSTS